MGPYLGDYAEDGTLDMMWDSNNGSGGSVTRATDGTISVYKDNSTTQTTAGITDTEDFDGVTGIHQIRILLTDAFYAAQTDYVIVLSGAVIDGQTVNSVIGHFSIENRVADIRRINGGRTDGNNATLSLASLSVINSGGTSVVFRSSGGSGTGLLVEGNGSSPGFEAKGGVTGHGMSSIGGATSGHGFRTFGQGTASKGLDAEGDIAGISGLANNATSGRGFQANGSGSGAGFRTTGGATGSGLDAQGGPDAGSGISAIAFTDTAAGHGIFASGDAGGNGMHIVGDAAGTGLLIQGGLTGDGMSMTGGASSGAGFTSTGDFGGIISGNNASADGLSLSGGTTSGAGLRTSGFIGIEVTGSGAGPGIKTTGGSTGHGIESLGGATSGTGFRIVGGASGDGLVVLGGSTSGCGADIKGTGFGSGLQLTGTGSRSGLKITGNNTAPGLDIIAGALSAGIRSTGGVTSGNGFEAIAPTNGSGMIATGASNGSGIRINGAGSGAGFESTGGTTGSGMKSTGGVTSGHGFEVTAGPIGDGIQAQGGSTSGDGLDLSAITSGNGILATGAGSGHGASFVKGATGLDIDADQLEPIAFLSEGKHFYVDSTNGLDSNDGSQALPFKNPSIAAAAVGTGDFVHIVDAATILTDGDVTWTSFVTIIHESTDDLENFWDASGADTFLWKFTKGCNLIGVTSTEFDAVKKDVIFDGSTGTEKFTMKDVNISRMRLDMAFAHSLVITGTSQVNEMDWNGALLTHYQQLGGTITKGIGGFIGSNMNIQNANIAVPGQIIAGQMFISQTDWLTDMDLSGTFNSGVMNRVQVRGNFTGGAAAGGSNVGTLICTDVEFFGDVDTGRPAALDLFVDIGTGCTIKGNAIIRGTNSFHPRSVQGNVTVSANATGVTISDTEIRGTLTTTAAGTGTRIDWVTHDGLTDNGTGTKIGPNVYDWDEKKGSATWDALPADHQTVPSMGSYAQINAMGMRFDFVTYPTDGDVILFYDSVNTGTPVFWAPVRDDANGQPGSTANVAFRFDALQDFGSSPPT